MSPGANTQTTRPDPFQEAYDELMGFEVLRDGWDGPGTYAPSQEVRERALTIFMATRTAAPVAPGVFATDDGYIDLHWPIRLRADGRATIELRVLDKGTVLRVRLHGQRRYLVPDLKLDDEQAMKRVIEHLHSSV